MEDLKCRDCGYEFEIQWRKLTENSKGIKKCPCCSGQILSDLNRVSTTRPDLMKYLINKDINSDDNSDSDANKKEN